MSNVYYEVTDADPYDKVHVFHSLREAVEFSDDCYGFKSLCKVTQEDMTHLLPDLRELLRT